jgi:hypothetical protein
MKAVYVALVEVTPLPGCEICPEDTKGGYARCYAPGDDAEDAEQAVRRMLEEERLRVVDVEWCLGYDDTEWEDPESEEAAECVREAQESGEVILGRLDTWSEDGDEEGEGGEAN